MTPERWEEIKEMIIDKFDVDDHDEYNLDPGPGSMEFLEFESPMGMMRAEFTTKPKIVDRRVHTSKRIGASVREDIIFSDTENTYHFEMYKWNDAQNEWDPIDAANLFQQQ